MKNPDLINHLVGH